MNKPFAALLRILDEAGPLAIAVSGGVDSMTLATAAHRHAQTPPLIVHAISPAVPPEATERVRDQAARENWQLHIGDAQEFADPDYRANPVNRCFYCKTNLYGFIAALSDRVTASGTNLDDLGDYRPGLQAAANHNVIHPLFSARFTKPMVRDLARWINLPHLADLPAAPCLASRIATGLRVTPAQMQFVHRVERMVQQTIAPSIVRCRVFPDTIVIQLDEQAMPRVTPALQAELTKICRAHGYPAPPAIEPYRRGSAFLHQAAS